MFSCSLHFPERTIPSFPCLCSHILSLLNNQALCCLYVPVLKVRWAGSLTSLPLSVFSTLISARLYLRPISRLRTLYVVNFPLGRWRLFKLWLVVIFKMKPLLEPDGGLFQWSFAVVVVTPASTRLWGGSGPVGEAHGELLFVVSLKPLSHH